MTIGAGTRLGPYEVIAPLGAGGMGEVSRAAAIPCQPALPSMDEGRALI